MTIGIKFSKNFGHGNCIECKTKFRRHSSNHVRCCKCAGWYRNSTKPTDTIVMDTTIYPKRTWGKKRPDTISRSTLIRRKKIKNFYW